MLLSALFVSSFGLAPGESHEAFGIEIACTGLVVVVQAVWVSVSKYNAKDPLWWTLQPLAALLLPGVTFVVGGISVAVVAGGGLYWVLAGRCSRTSLPQWRLGFFSSKFCDKKAHEFWIRVDS